MGAEIEEKKRWLAHVHWGRWASAALVTIAALVLASVFAEPSPPRAFRIATGSPEGNYYAVAQEYKKRLARDGITLEVVPTAGSIENLRLLRDGEVDLALVQGGTAAEADAEALQSLASVYFEPLWVFHRGEPLRHLYELKGKKIAVGPEGSGTRSIAVELLSINGVTDQTATLLPLGGGDVAAALEAGEVDAAFLVLSPEARVIRRLAAARDVDLMSFGRATAYHNHYRFLSSVTLPEGALDLSRNLPPGEKVLLAPAAALVARRDLHPAIASLLLTEITPVHRGGGLLAEPGLFPSSKYVDVPLGEDAVRYFEHGPPFWAASLIDRLTIMILPLITILFPLAKVAPPIYRWRIRSGVYRWYEALREVEQNAARRTVQESLERLKKTEDEIDQVKVPLSYMAEFYMLQTHLEFVKAKIASLAEASDDADGPGA